MGRAFSDLGGQKPFIINIDHHVTNTQFGDINLIEPQATSTAEILYRLFGELNIVISEDIALSLLTGLVTDTLGFRTTGVTAETLRTGADLVEAGADLGFRDHARPQYALHVDDGIMADGFEQDAF